MNDIEKINVAPNSYFQRIVKPCLLDLRKRKDNAKTDKVVVMLPPEYQKERVND